MKHPLTWLRDAGLVVVLAGDSFAVLGLSSLQADRRKRCIRYCKEHKAEILEALRAEERAWKVLPLAWFRDLGLELSLDESGQVVWAVKPGWEKFWNVKPGALPTRAQGTLPDDCEWQCWQYACRHRRELLAALQPCKGWKPTKPIKEGESLEELVAALEEERKRGLATICPFLEMWIFLKDCPRWCGRWNEPLTEREKQYWAALWKDEKPKAA